MERDSEVFLAKRRWKDLYVRTAFGIRIDEVLRGNSWCNPTVRALFELAQLRSSRQAWFPFGRETYDYLLEYEREAEFRNMNLGVDMGSLFTSLIVRQNG